MADSSAHNPTSTPTTTTPVQPPALRHIGRPRKWTDAESLLARADEYFNECVENKKPLTITGLCRAIGTVRQTMLDYINGHAPSNGDSADILDALKHIRQRCEEYAEEHIFTARNPAGGIFALKNYGWKDTQTIETTGFVEHRADPETLAVLGDFLASLSAPRIPAPADVISVEDVRSLDVAPVPEDRNNKAPVITDVIPAIGKDT